MAQNYEIDIKRFNGQDYDTLLPTPAAHASTHQADGSDPLTLQTGNYGAASIPTSAYKDASVTRAKLALDALYSPTSYSDSKNITVSDLGKTIYAPWNASPTYTLTQADSSNIPIGGEVAIMRWGNSGSSTVSIVPDGVRFAITGESSIKSTGTTLKIPDVFGMVALKKISQDASNGDAWLVTGNVEVVS